MMNSQMNNQMVSVGKTAMTPFSFDSHEIRVITDEHGNPWWVAKDIASALGYQNKNDAISKHCRGVAKRYPIVDALGRTQEARIISEGDVMRLIVSSKLPSAEQFERWVFDEVLPTIRKTGGYATQALTPVEALLQSVQRMVEQERRLSDIASRLNETERRLDGMNGDTGYMTALAYCRKVGIPAPLSFAKRLGIKASDLCRTLSIRMGQVPDERWGSVNSYPVEVLRECHHTMDEA